MNAGTYYIAHFMHNSMEIANDYVQIYIKGHFKFQLKKHKHPFSFDFNLYTSFQTHLHFYISLQKMVCNIQQEKLTVILFTLFTLSRYVCSFNVSLLCLNKNDHFLCSGLKYYDFFRYCFSIHNVVQTQKNKPQL